MESLLTTKFYAPPIRAEYVTRSRLTDQLNQGLRRKLTLISAPAGFGKTTLVSEWLQHCEDPVVWLSLDQNDNDLGRFLKYFIAALNQIAAMDTPIGDGALSMLQSPQPPPTEAILTSLLNDIAMNPAHFVLVLDDYHVIETSHIDKALIFLLEHLPPQMHFIMATREDPRLPLARLRARGQLIELRAMDLRFTTSEAAEFLNQVMGLNLSAPDIAALETRTEGWIVGLQLAAISMQGRENKSPLVQSFSGSHRYVLNYLIEEVLNQQPQQIQDFLLQTAILDQLNAPLCNAMTGQDTGQATLDALQRANLFIIPLDEERHWYRYHHLFSDLLRQRIRQTQPEQIPILHRKASEWFEQNEYTELAIEHALHSGEFEHSAQMIASFEDDVWRLGEHTQLRRWLSRLPEDVVLSNPHLCMLQATYQIISGQIDEAERYLQSVEQNLSPDQMKIRGRAAVLRAHAVSYQGDLSAAIQYAQQALDALPAGDSAWRSSAFDSLGTAYNFIGDIRSAYRARSEAVEASQEAGNIYMMLFASLRLVVTREIWGIYNKPLKSASSR